MTARGTWTLEPSDILAASMNVQRAGLNNGLFENKRQPSNAPAHLGCRHLPRAALSQWKQLAGFACVSVHLP